MGQLNRVGALIFALSFVFFVKPGISQPATAAQQQQPDLHLVLKTLDGRTQFHLGEIVELELAYSSDVPDKYLMLSLPAKIKGHSAKTTIFPDQHVIDRLQDDGTRSTYSVLHVNCNGGIGFGVGGSCGDCDAEWPLTRNPIRFQYSLNSQFQVTGPGHYVVQAEAASVVRAPLDLATSVPISLVSNTFEIDIVNDPAWSELKLREAIARLEAAHTKYVNKGWDTIPRDRVGTEDLGERHDLQFAMQTATEVMRVLDTEESLAEVVRRYDGTEQSPDFLNHVLLRAIVQSKHRPLAVKLLGARILDPDFAVTKNLLDQLTAMALEVQFPGSLDHNDAESLRTHYPHARELLKGYVSALGESLPEKKPGALETSLQAFKAFAREDFCDGQPLLPQSAFKQMLHAVQAFDSEPEQ